MKLLRLLVLLLSLSNTSFAQLEVIVKGIKNDKGNIRVGLFKDKESFLKKAAYGKVVKAQKGDVSVIFSVPEGLYAVSIIHDENENDELDSNFIGIPKEGFGFANDAMGNFGPPSFEKASITVETGKRTINITLRYL
jgi:uncharacterized protein (DUF2141 family)